MNIVRGFRKRQVVHIVFFFIFYLSIYPRYGILELTTSILFMS